MTCVGIFWLGGRSSAAASAAANTRLRHCRIGLEFILCLVLLLAASTSPSEKGHKFNTKKIAIFYINVQTFNYIFPNADKYCLRKPFIRISAFIIANPCSHIPSFINIFSTLKSGCVLLTLEQDRTVLDKINNLSNFTKNI